MKIKPEHLERLRQLVAVTNTPANRALYAKRDPRLWNINEAKNLSRRFRWDCMWGDCIPTLTPEQKKLHVDTRRPLVDELYKYMTDEHIDTALAHLIKPIQEVK
ncbi:hypothetical protein Phage2-1_00111 [Achromobacter phage 2-1]|nr:hypothetical protein Phage2-1_00111 [Achromobacter phage 2-1]